MQELLKWCQIHAPADIVNSGTYAMLDYMHEKIVNKYIPKNSNYDITFLRQMTTKELTTVEPNEQYITLIGHIYALGIDNIQPERMITFIDWMFNSNDFETGLIAYFWSNSLLNNYSLYPLHSDMLQIVDYGCNRYTLRFLWDVAKSGDTVIGDIVKALAIEIEAPPFLKMMSYTYLCSSCSSQMLTQFFYDIGNINSENISSLTDSFTLYTWSYDVIDSLLDKGYSIRKMYKIIEDFASNSFISCGREFPVSRIPKRLIRSRHKGSSIFRNLPAIPTDYKIYYKFWNNSYPDEKIVIKQPVKNKYELWFERLSNKQLERFSNMNPVVFNACCNNEFMYVKETLDELMHILEVKK